MKTALPTPPDNLINTLGDIIPEPADTKVPSNTMRVFQQGISALQSKLSTRSSQVLILTVLGMLAGTYLAKKITNRPAVPYTINRRFSVSPLHLISPKVPNHPIPRGSEASLIAPASHKVGSEEAMLQQSRGRHGSGASQLTNDSGKDPNPDTRKHGEHKDKEQDETSGGPYYNTVHSATDRAAQMVTSVNHGNIYNGCTVIQAGWAVIGAFAATLALMLINRE